MRLQTPPLKSLAFASVLLVGSLSASAQSAYFEAVTNLNPVLYFPLQETNQPPIADVETNLGSLGPSGNAVYSSANMNKAQSGVIQDGDFSVFATDAAGGFCAVPTTDPRTAVQSPTMTVEAWVNPAETNRNFEGIVCKSGGNANGINGANNQGGWCLSENYIAYLDNANMIGFDFHVYNGKGHGGAEVIVPFNVQVSTWYHLVATFDGTNCLLYLNGTNMVANGYGYQMPMTGSYVQDTWNPIQIGSSRNLNGNNYHGNIDEVAIYTNVLSPTQVLNHFNAQTNTVPGAYPAIILADNPYMYWRMDSPGYTAPSMTNYPIATNYGNYPSVVAGLYGTASQPGVSGPQFPGMLDPNNGNQSLALAVNGIGGNNGNTENILSGYDTNGNTVPANDAVPFIITNLSRTVDTNTVLIYPTNHAPFSFTIWFRGNPDYHDRFQTICGSGDSGWRFNMVQGAGVVRWNPGAGGEQGTPFAYNDGNWHDFVGTYDGTNILTYVDGILVATIANTSVNSGTTLFPVLGGAPDYLDSGNDYNNHTGYAQRDFSGTLAHFAFFTNVLTAGQIQNLYSNAVPNQAPYILAQPVTGRVNPAPGFLFFGVVAGGTGPLGYQWYFNATSNYSGATLLVSDGVKYVGTTTSQMTVSNLVNSDSGYYYVVVSNGSGSVTSILASLSVNYAPVITSQNPLNNFTLFVSQTFALSVTATAETNNSYFWYTNGIFDSSAGKNATYNLGPVSLANNGETFQCVVSNADGLATNNIVGLTVLTLPAFLTNSAFSSNTLALHPTAYWPMHDAGQAAVQGSVETNLGTLGAIGTAFYDDWRQTMLGSDGNILGNSGITNNEWLIHGFPGAIAGDPDPAVEMSGANRSYLVVPRVSPTVSGTTPANTTLTPPFTLEAWCKPLNNRSFGVMLGEDGGNLNSVNSRGGFDWLYSGTANSFSMTVFNGNGGGNSEPKTASIYPPGVWYHVVTTYDGTNVQYYINGVADAMTGVNGTNGTLATINLNTWDPITIGCGRGLNNNTFQGVLDEVAVYTNILSPTVIQAHYNNGINASYHNYSSDVLTNNPLLYYRMDAPAWTVPSTNTWPVMTNYGAVGVNGLYTPGALPASGPGPSEDGHLITGFGATNSFQANGCSIFADALNTSAFHPGSRTPISVACWVKGNPSDVASHNWQGFVSDSDGSWRSDYNAGNGRGNFNPNNGQDVGNSTVSGASIIVNDGNWHYFVGTYDGTNSIVYVDGVVSARWTTNNNTSSVNAEAFVGAYPNNAAYGDTLTSLGNEIGRVLAGSICEAAFWNGTALSSNQIHTLYSSLQVAPVIDVQPFSASPNGNSKFTNSVLVSGSSPITYQWYNNGSPLPTGGQTNLPFGGTNASLIFVPVLPSDGGSNYYVVVSNPYGSATSAVWTLTVIATPPIITNNISNTNISLFPGGHTSFSIGTIGYQPITYQWYSNDVAISGATTNSYSIINAQPPGTVQNYYCVASNILSIASNTLGTTSAVATVTVVAFPTAMYPATILADNPIGFWRLNETNDVPPNDGTIAHDYWGANNGVYSNVDINQMPGYNPNCEPTQPSVQFGILTFSNSMVFGIPTNVDFATPSGSNAEFSVEAWANGFAQTGDNGIVSKGYGGGGEEFSLDTGSNPGGGITHAFRFFVRTAAGTAPGAAATNAPDGTWHHLVGVCDESNGIVALYVDGVLAGSNTIASGAGIQPSPRASGDTTGSSTTVRIGSRASTNAVGYNLQFVGNISDVSLYSYALTPAQVLNHYYAACIAAHFIVQPTNTVAGQGGTATLSAVVDGTPFVSEQWFSGSPGSGTAISGETNSTLVLPNVQPAQAGSYYLEVSNIYNATPVDSQGVTLTVVSGAPQIFVDVPTNVLVPQGFTISIPVTAYGTEPLTYQWQMGTTNGQSFVNLSDNSRITGSLSNILTIANAQIGDIGDYQVIIANGSGSITSSIAALTVASEPVSFYVNGGGWTTQTNSGSGFGTPAFNNGLLTLTDNAGNEARSAFFQFKQYIGAFKAFWTYQASGNKAADGMAFVLQNDSRGANALGGGGGSLGVSGISPSWELELNIYTGNNDGIGCGIFTNGANGINTLGTNVLVSSGDPIDFSLNYAKARLTLTMVDEMNTNLSFTTNINMDLTIAAGGQTAYIGFTGATGGSQSTQTITNFAFVPLTSASIANTSTNSAVITWPAIIGGYTLLQSPSLTAPSWTPVPFPDNIVNSNHQVVVPTTGVTNQFYRLSVPF